MGAGSTQKIDTKKIIDDLLKNFSGKEKNIVKRRFGLDRTGRETLEKVGGAHKLTRERIRQIEKAIIDKIHEIKEAQEELAQLKEVVLLLLEEHGGIAEKKHLFDILDKISDVNLNFKDEGKKKAIKENHLDFIFSRIFSDHLEEVKRSDKFKDSYKLKNYSLEHLEELADELSTKIQKLDEVIQTRELINFISGLESYSKHKDKLNKPTKVVLHHLVDGNGLGQEDREIFEEYRVLYSLLQAVREVEKNKFGHWGYHSWNEIKPKTVNDKIYLVLKNHGKPMHFTEIAEHINSAGFDHKKTNPATVHNELILDDKYVLIGRGIYGLNEWGLKKGTVTEVIRDILSSSEEPLTREEIVDKVLENRLVKESTINLALSNRKEFKKIGDKYVLA